MKNMSLRLIDLLYHIEPDTVIWVSTDENDERCCLYFGEAEKITVGILRGCTVVKFYPERYPAKFCTGISVIVERKESA
ncbi:MAG: hypothetical protein IJ418_13125 [Clostridia bacterium]|nr:hypothetical protein [Clostridia bacterium]